MVMGEGRNPGAEHLRALGKKHALKKAPGNSRDGGSVNRAVAASTPSRPVCAQSPLSTSPVIMQGWANSGTKASSALVVNLASIVMDTTSF